VTAKLYSTFIAMYPQPKQRPKVVTRANAPYPIAITPDETLNAEARIKTHVAAEWLPREPYTGPVQLQVTALRQKPKAAPKTKRTWPTGRPDWDNLGKLVSDALNGIVYRDDSQVCRAYVEKDYTSPERPTEGFGIVILALDADLEAV
jgi:Holliday junction resolvase RusA-like endonuclease